MTSDVTMHELEAETAELLPSRETLSCYKSHPCGGGGSSVVQIGLVNFNNSFNNYGILGF